ncbi:MAG: right-handed parallel beta-helix repeat-containing protein [Thermoplasmatota archaeon]
MRKCFIVVFVLFIGCFNGNVFSGEQRVNDILYVDDDGGADFVSIQEAIDAASSGDTIFVHSGWYNETVEINASLTLIGEDKNTTIIEGGKRSDVVTISSDNVCFSGFTIQNSSTVVREGWWKAGIRIIASDVLVENNIIRDNLNGVFVKRVENLTLRNNLFYYDSLTLYPYDADYDPRPNLKRLHYDHVIEGNLVNDKPLVYMVDESDTVISSDVGQLILVNCTNVSVQDVSIISADFPLLFVFCENCALMNCSFFDNQGECTFLDSDDNQVYGNVFEGNFHGLLLDYGSESNDISHNLFSNNRFCGLICEYFSNENRMVHNDFIDNRGANAFLIKAFHNEWEQNYWSDWIGLTNPFFQMFPKMITGTLFESNQRIVSLINIDVSPQFEPQSYQ